MFGGLLLVEGKGPLYKEGKKEVKKGETRGNLGFSICDAEPQAGKSIEDAVSWPLNCTQQVRKGND